ncbi:class I SAM-dependent methyltransferase [Sulfurospirillum sp. UCH001]|uniref:class I SAM-dependent methyltransferase n=1 Tax=Sulfurospirillum sp. UCH001 TaxID=1581011 RepID=UPI000831CE3A|nr:class I SAM-dependent methyltransferase [Sulfurospirillum sp. UCH001]
MKKILKKIDVIASKYIRLKYRHFVKYDPLLDTEGQYTKEDWEKHRDYINIYKNSDDYNTAFLNKVLFDELNKAVAVFELLQVFDFSKINSLIEIGCGYMYQSFLLKQKFPHLHYTASDYDENVIKQSSNVQLLKNIEKVKFNVLEDELALEYDMAISWAVDYHFTDNEIQVIFDKFSKNNTNYLILSLTIATPVRKFKDLINNYKNNKMIEKKFIRAHGWERSLKYLEILGMKSGFNFKYIGKCGDYHALWFYKS